MTAEHETIDGVAFRYEDTGLVCKLPAPKRHFHLIEALWKLGVTDITGPHCTQGFYTNTGRFVDRMEAGRIADASGQAKRTDGSYKGNILYSEDLW